MWWADDDNEPKFTASEYIEIFTRFLKEEKIFKQFFMELDAYRNDEIFFLNEKYRFPNVIGYILSTEIRREHPFTFLFNLERSILGEEYWNDVEAKFRFVYYRQIRHEFLTGNF